MQDIHQLRYHMTIAIHLDSMYIAAFFHQIVVHGAYDVHINIPAVYDFLDQQISRAPRAYDQHIFPFGLLSGHFCTHHPQRTVKIPSKNRKQH